MHSDRLGAEATSFRPLQVLIFSKEYLSRTETFIQTALLELDKKDIVTVLCTQRKNSHLYTFHNIVQIVYHTPYLLRKIKSLSWRLHIATKRWHSSQFAATLAQFISWSDIEVIHCHFGHKALLLIDNLPKSIYQNTPIFITFHGYDASSKLRSSRAYRKRLQVLFRQPNIYPLFVSQALCHQVSQYGLKSANSQVLYLGIDLEKFHRSGYPDGDSGKTFLQVASFREKKGQIYTIRAFHQLTQSCGKEHQLILVGEGPQLEAARQLTVSLGIAELVHFPGACAPDAVPNWLSQAHIYVHHSVTGADGDTEGLPVSIMEAMAMELPVLASRHAGIPELVEDGVNGLLSPERDVDHLADAMERILDWSFLPENRVKIEQGFSKEAHSRQLQAAFRSAIS